MMLQFPYSTKSPDGMGRNGCLAVVFLANGEKNRPHRRHRTRRRDTAQGIGRREIKLHFRDFLALATIIH